MTRESLLQAISAHEESEGSGLERVLKAARANELYCSNPGKCLLAVAWSKEDKYITVGGVSFGYYSTTTGEDELNPDGTLKRFPHPYSSIFYWFDSLLYEAAEVADSRGSDLDRINREVLRILEDD